MTKPMRREIATQKADMPHKFDGDGELCETCVGVVNDVKHVSWENWQVASRETAAEQRTWEVGS